MESVQAALVQRASLQDVDSAPGHSNAALQLAHVRALLQVAMLGPCTAHFRHTLMLQ